MRMDDETLYKKFSDSYANGGHKFQFQFNETNNVNITNHYA